MSVSTMDKVQLPAEGENDGSSHGDSDAEELEMGELSLGLERVLREAHETAIKSVQKNSGDTALDRQKRKSAYVVKMFQGSKTLLGEEVRFPVVASAGCIARCCSLPFGRQFSLDMMKLGVHTRLVNIMDMPSFAYDPKVQARGCQALRGILAAASLPERMGVGKKTTGRAVLADVAACPDSSPLVSSFVALPSEQELQMDILLAGAGPVAVRILESLPLEVAPVVEALNLLALLACGNRSTAKALRKKHAVPAVQEILATHAEINALSKQVVLEPAKVCLGHLWFGGKKRRLGRPGE